MPPLRLHAGKCRHGQFSCQQNPGMKSISKLLVFFYEVIFAFGIVARAGDWGQTILDRGRSSFLSPFLTILNAVPSPHCLIRGGDIQQPLMGIVSHVAD